MSRFIKICAISAMCFSGSVFAHGHHGFHGYGGYGGYGYGPYFGGVYVAPAAGYYPRPYYAAPQPYYAPPQPNYYGYGQPAPMYGQYR